MNYNKKIKVIVLSALVSTLVVGCGSSSDALSTTENSTTLSGVAIDPELQGANVFLDENRNSLYDIGELNTTTDNNGKYSLSIPNDKMGLPLVVRGGYDKTTKNAFAGSLSSVTQAGVSSSNITPLTTLVQKYKEQNPTQSVESIQASLASKLGISSEDFSKNTVESGNENLLKLSLRIHKASQSVSQSSGKSNDVIYALIAEQLQTDATITEAIDNSINREIASSLERAKAKNLDANIEKLDHTTLTAEQIALSADRVETTLKSKTTEAEVSLVDVKRDSRLLVDDSAKVQVAKTQQTFNALGLEKLDDATKEKFAQDPKFDVNNDSIEEIRKKLENGDFQSLDTNDKKNIKTEQFFQNNGFNELDATNRDSLKQKFDDNGFDFENANSDDFRTKLNENDFFGNDETLKTKVEAQMNQTEFQDKLNNTNTTTVADGKLIVGSIVKGPIDGALITLKDASGVVVASTISTKGIFIFPEQTLTSTSYTLESSGGSYEDEATKTTVNLSETQGLKTYLTKEELRTILANKEYIAMTPETTIYTALVQNGATTTEAKTLITRAMITDSSPLAILPGDKFLQTGDFTSAFPKDQSEAFARNRAISFSYMVRDLNLAADKVFDILNLLVEDYKDGKADGITLADGRDVNVTKEFALSRTKLFQDTTSKLRDGSLSDGQKEQLNQMGFDTTAFSNQTGSSESNLSAIVDKYLTATTLPTLHVLPVIADEDGNANDNKESYTLTANTNVNVTIETPEGSWITPMWRYNNSPLPVVIHANRGDAMTLTLQNKLASDSTIHWHGFKIPAEMDGGPDYPVAAGASKVYSFTMNQPAAPLWFHPHPDMETGKQVYMGLAGVYLLEDDVSKELEANKQLPSGDKDTILLVQDRRFTTENGGVKELAYKTLDRDSDGMLGDTILVNGSVLPKQEVSNTLHRYRLYNVSNARAYDFALSDGSDFTIVGTDGGLLEKPTTVNHIVLGAAERVEVVIDFSKYSVNDKVMLVSQPFNGGSMGMMGNMGSMGATTGTTSQGMGSMGATTGTTSQGMGSMGATTGTTSQGMGSMGVTTGTTSQSMGSIGNISNMSGINGNSDNSISGMLNNGEGLAIMRFDITSSEVEDITLYTTLPSRAEIVTRTLESSANNVGNEREFLMSMGMNGTMSFVINGKSFDANRIDEYVPAGATEIWKITNMSPMAHPFHAHAIQYQILTRNGIAATGTDLGWKDTFLVQPGESVRVIGDFSEASGDYMYHCHILEHEDAGMMGYFRVGDTGHIGN